jgi:anaerobic selenocysteine-containing dehydrogenase
MIRTSEVLGPRLDNQLLVIHPADGDKLDLVEGARAEIKIGDESYTGLIKLDARVPQGVILVPRSMGIPLAAPVNAEIKGLD